MGHDREDRRSTAISPSPLNDFGHRVLGDDVHAPVQQQVPASFVRRRIARDRVVVGRDHREPDALGERLTGSLEKRRFCTLDVCQQQVERSTSNRSRTDSRLDVATGASSPSLSQ